MSLRAPINLIDLSVVFSRKTCFEGFSARIQPGGRIAVVGENGSGKSSLLRVIAGELEPSSGKVVSSGKLSMLPQGMDMAGSVWEVATEEVQPVLKLLEQLGMEGVDYDALLEKIYACDGFELEHRVEKLLSLMGLAEKREARSEELSGGQRMLLALVRMLAPQPSAIFLDEPTNHLDSDNRQRLLRLLMDWEGAAVVATHDLDLLNSWATRIWSIESGAVKVFDGRWPDFERESEIADTKRRDEWEGAVKEKKAASRSMDQEMKRAASSAKKGKKKYADEGKIVRKAKKGQAERTHARKKKHIVGVRAETEERIRELRTPNTLTPKFHFGVDKKRSPFSIRVEGGSAGYPGTPVLKNIDFRISSGERVALQGANGSGKTTLMRALVGDPEVERSGVWDLPANALERIGYLDQHCSILDLEKSPFQTIQELCPDWTEERIIAHLNSYLFLHMKMIKGAATNFSGGEKVRLALAILGAKTPDLLILDEVTNNIDLATKEQLKAVLLAYPGALLINCHEEDFLAGLGIDRRIDAAAYHFTV